MLHLHIPTGNWTVDQYDCNFGHSNTNRNVIVTNSLQVILCALCCFLTPSIQIVLLHIIIYKKPEKRGDLAFLFCNNSLLD